MARKPGLISRLFSLGHSRPAVATAQTRRLASLNSQNRTLRARLDNAETTTDNSKWWANADGLSADAAASNARRTVLRKRARYEIANNSYARGIVSTLANDTIGTGPRLQLRDAPKRSASDTERAFSAWADSINLAEKLRTMRMAVTGDGEAFGILGGNPLLPGPVKLTLRLIEADLVTDPTIMATHDADWVDGIHYDGHGNPKTYRVLNHHPGNHYGGWDLTYKDHAAADVIHLYRADRPDQHRGLPEIMPALGIFAELRRYCDAVIAAAETAADYAAVIHSREPVEGIDADSVTVAAMDVFELERRMATVLPEGYSLDQIKAEQPTTTYDTFVAAKLREAARCMGMPYNVAAGDSSSYNYASGRLDHQTYHKSIRVFRHQIELVVLNRIFQAWLREYLSTTAGVRISEVDANFSVEYRPTWFWDGFEHVDPLKNANAKKVLLQSGLLTLADYWGEEGKDWEQQEDQREKEAKRRAEQQSQTEGETGDADKQKTDG